MKRFFSQLHFVLAFLFLTAAVFSTGCGGSGSDPIGGGSDSASVRLSGKISTSDASTSLREGLRGAGTALVDLYYIDGAGAPVPLTNGNSFNVTGNEATYDFSAFIPSEAINKKNFVLKAVIGNQTIEGIIPFDPNIEKTIQAPKITPEHIGLVQLAIKSAQEGIPNINMTDVLSLYTPADIKAMLLQNGNPGSDMTNLVNKLKQKEAQFLAATNALSAEQARKIEALMAYGNTLSRDPRYIGFENRDAFKAAMDAKAEELGLTPEAQMKFDEVSLMFIGSGIPTPPISNPQNFAQFVQSAAFSVQELINGQDDPQSVIVNYFTNIYSNDSDIVALKALFISKKQIFYGYLLQGISPNPQSLDNPIRVIEELRRKVFAKVDPGAALLGNPDLMSASPQTTIQAIAANLTQLSLPVTQEEIPVFHERLDMLALMSMPTQQRGM
ncbi:MAG: hypothetical protein PHF29_05870 [Candidatus Riflebacteria bacterium]|nr:hypothetical protein [Candidatus Riflebacteria bacterium]